VIWTVDSSSAQLDRPPMTDDDASGVPGCWGVEPDPPVSPEGPPCVPSLVDSSSEEDAVSAPSLEERKDDFAVIQAAKAASYARFSSELTRLKEHFCSFAWVSTDFLSRTYSR